MAFPQELSQHFSPALVRALGLGSETREPEPGLSLGHPEIDALLPDGGLFRGGVVEVVAGTGAPVTTLLLGACRVLQAQASDSMGAGGFCAFVDPTGTLHAPGLVKLGVRLDRLLIVRPPLEALPRTALRLAKSRAFELVVIDTVGVPGQPLRIPLKAWVRHVRRLSLEVERSKQSIVLITDLNAPRDLPLPVSQRIEIGRPALDRLSVRIAKDHRGRLLQSRQVTWGSAPNGFETSEEARHARVG